MNRLKVFDRALFGKKVGCVFMIVVLDVICLVIGPFFGQMNFMSVSYTLIAINMLNTCILYHSFIISTGAVGFELNTEKMVYFPTTRAQFLINKYAKTLIFLVIQLILTLACLGLGDLTVHGTMDNSRYIGSCLVVYLSILLTSGAAILVMHFMPFGIYISLLLYYPITLLAKGIELLHQQISYSVNELGLVALVVIAVFALWLLLLWLGIRIYEKVT